MLYLCTRFREKLCKYSIGMWRSPVAQRSGGPEVASSNLVIPTKSKKPPTQGVFFVPKSQ